jgi:hypothetical protein
MRRIRSDRGISLGGVQGAIGERRHIVGVDDVVRESGMIGLFGE